MAKKETEKTKIHAQNADTFFFVTDQILLCFSFRF